MEAFPYFNREPNRLLPVANIFRIMRFQLPATAKVAKDAKEIIQECVSEFIGFVASEASDRLRDERRKTITGDDIVNSMRSLGFDIFLPSLQAYLEKFRSVHGRRDMAPLPASSSSAGGRARKKAKAATSAEEDEEFEDEDEDEYDDEYYDDDDVDDDHAERFDGEASATIASLQAASSSSTAASSSSSSNKRTHQQLQPPYHIPVPVPSSSVSQPSSASGNVLASVIAPTAPAASNGSAISGIVPNQPLTLEMLVALAQQQQQQQLQMQQQHPQTKP